MVLAAANIKSRTAGAMTDKNLGEFARRIQYEATVKTLSKGSTEEQLITLTDNALSLTSNLLDEVKRRSTPLACCSGCNFCCYLMATVSGPEALAIARRLEKSYSEEELKHLKQKIKRAYQQTKKMDNLARIRAGIPCPFLMEDRLCSIYTYRPLDCVTYHSLSRQACEEILEQPDRGHPTNATLRAIAIGIKTGLGQGIVEANLEQPAFRYEFIEAIHICLNDKRAMDKYLAGQNLFKSAAIMIDSESGVSHKIKYAPPRLKALAKRLIAQERRQARQLARSEQVRKTRKTQHQKRKSSL